MTWPQIWYGSAASERIARAVLVPMSWLYALGWSCYRWLYDTGIKRPQKPYSPILVIGNLTVGGSGKTPVTVHVAQLLLTVGRSVVIGCSGYGGEHEQGASLAPEGPLDPKLWGDEPALIRALLPDVPMIVGRARVQAAEIMRSLNLSAAVLVMDDGFQHLPLEKTASILLDPPSPNHHCLPAGPYREPRSNLRRADLVIPGPEFAVREEIIGFEKLAAFGSGHFHDLSGREVDLLCAIGRPAAFAESVQATGIDVQSVRTYPDHDNLLSVDWQTLKPPIVITAKDAIKLRANPKAPTDDIYVARHRAWVEPAVEFQATLLELIWQE